MHNLLRLGYKKMLLLTPVNVQENYYPDYIYLIHDACSYGIGEVTAIVASPINTLTKESDDSHKNLY